MNIFDNRPDFPPSQSAQSLYDSSHSSGRKRKRDGSESPIRSRFTNASKNMVKVRCNTGECWSCEAPGPAEFCHVVGQADPAYFVIMETGMNTFGELGDYRNAVVLCPSCHAHFDRGVYAPWTFLPTYPQFFIDYEIRDFAERLQRWKSTGNILDRRYPDEQDYEKYCRTVVGLGPDDGLCRGGVYDRHILQAIFPTQVMAAYGLETLPGLMYGVSKRWHGAPMASIVKGMSVLGAVKRRFPKDVSDKLRELQDLYARDLQTETGAIETLVSDRPQDGQPTADSGPGGGEFTGSTDDMQSPARQRSHSQFPPREGRGSYQNEHYEDRWSDSAIDVRHVNHTGKRRQKGGSGSHEARAHGLRRKKCRSDSIGIDQDTWCFGPNSRSVDKMRGRYWCAGEVG